MRILLVLAAIAAGAITISAVSLLLFLGEARRRAETHLPDAEWLAAYMRAHPAFIRAINDELTLAEHRAAIDAWQGEL